MLGNWYWKTWKILGSAINNKNEKLWPENKTAENVLKYLSCVDVALWSGPERPHRQRHEYKQEQAHILRINNKWILSKRLMLNVSCKCVQTGCSVASHCNCIISNTNLKRIHFKRYYFHEHLMRTLRHCETNWNCNFGIKFLRQL